MLGVSSENSNQSSIRVRADLPHAKQRQGDRCRGLPRGWSRLHCRRGPPPAVIHIPSTTVLLEGRKIAKKIARGWPVSNAFPHFPYRRNMTNETWERDNARRKAKKTAFGRPGETNLVRPPSSPAVQPPLRPRIVSLALKPFFLKTPPRRPFLEGLSSKTLP